MSWFYRTKNKIFRVLRIKLAFWGVLRLPKCRNLPVGSDQESPESIYEYVVSGTLPELIVGGFSNHPFAIYGYAATT